MGGEGGEGGAALGEFVRLVTVAVRKGAMDVQDARVSMCLADLAC